MRDMLLMQADNTTLLLLVMVFMIMAVALIVALTPKA